MRVNKKHAEPIFISTLCKIGALWEDAKRGLRRKQKSWLCMPFLEIGLEPLYAYVIYLLRPVLILKLGTL